MAAQISHVHVLLADDSTGKDFGLKNDIHTPCLRNP